jgi:formylglycine-generating enzyme required for sulfatase activity
MNLSASARSLLTATLCALAAAANADVFNMPAGQTSLQFVTVGDPGNVADTKVMSDGTSGYGSVSYTYQLGTFDVTSAQYTQFLNAVAKTDTYGLYSTAMGNAPTGATSASCRIVRSGTSGNFSYGVAPAYVNFPVNIVAWADAARFCNWLQNGQPTGSQGAGTTETGAYTLNGANTGAALAGVTRNPTAIYVIPTENEWYKAAYYKGGSMNAGYWLYPTQSDTRPVNTLPDTGNHANYYDSFGTGNGDYTDPVNFLTSVGAFSSSPGPYGTFDQGGDVMQLTEALTATSNPPTPDSFAHLRGGGFLKTNGSDVLAANYRVDIAFSTSNSAFDGFRIAAVPEPSTIVLMLFGTAALVALRRR